MHNEFGSPTPMRASIKTTLSGQLRGADSSLVWLSSVSVLGALGSMWLTCVTPWAIAGVAMFLIGYLFILYAWRTSITDRARMETPPTHIQITRDSVDFAGPIPSTLSGCELLLRLMRTGVHS